MEYTLYEAEDLAADESFISYYLAADEKHIEFWTSWIARYPEKQAVVLDAIWLLDAVHIRLEADEFAKERSRMLTFLDQPSVEMNEHQGASTRKLNWQRLAIAATVLVVCTIGFYLFRAEQTNRLSQTSWLTTVTAPGEQRAVTLTDGTRIVMNGGSKLHYPAEFRGSTRDVQFSGEGFFEVAKDARHPFEVQSGRFLTVVLGTRFNINTDHGIAVSLTEGKVRLTAPGIQPVLLTPGHEAYYTGNSIRVRSFDTSSVLAWKANRLVFRNASFAEIAEKMYRAYGMVLICKRPVKWSYSGEFERTDYRSILNTITYSKNLNYIVKRDTVIIQ